MTDTSARLALPFLVPSQAQKHVTHNEALERLDLLVQLAVEETGAQVPPALAQPGQAWALGPVPTGEWAGQAGKIAGRVESGWIFITPQDGWFALDKSTGRLRRWDGSDWADLTTPDMTALDGVGINTGYDTGNRLSVAADATLLTHDGAGHQLKINKATVSDTASLLFQTGWSGRAEMGTAGNDDFAIKVSTDGAAWTTAMTFSGDTGIATGAAVQQSPADATPGRLARADYVFGPGNLIGTVTQAAGLPTGAVIERGTGANGDYVRFADGTQICIHRLTGIAISTAVGSLYRSGAISWTFAKPFAADPVLSGSVAHAEGLSVNLSADKAGVTVGRAFALAPVAGAEIQMMAVGRWF